MQKNIAICIVLTFVTCGIYALYWVYSITEEAAKANPSEWSTSGGLAILLMMVTCGVYSVYWNYKMGKVFEPHTGTDNSILYLLLCVFGFQIINYALIQDQINSMYTI